MSIWIGLKVKFYLCDYLSFLWCEQYMLLFILFLSCRKGEERNQLYYISSLFFILLKKGEKKGHRYSPSGLYLLYILLVCGFTIFQQQVQFSKGFIAVFVSKNCIVRIANVRNISDIAITVGSEEISNF